MIGSKVAHFEITALLGSGGMGEVYQATDTKLGRSVAIKVLPEAFTNDPDRLARFEREARVLASLNHSNIAAIHGLEESGGRSLLIMELVEGETLADRIARGPIPTDEALPIAKQICEALEAAHEKGIIHRDLKPANIKITSDGKVKVLDFGLAKAMEGEAVNPNLSKSPTLSMAATNAGMILGTAAYMSPEQAKGRAVDRRTDIFSFGCVLYEMLTGRPPFDGEDVGEILARVIEREPDWSKLPSTIPPRPKELLRRCLEKDPKKRKQSAGDIRTDIELALAEPGATITASVSAGNSRLAWIVAGVTALVAAVLTVPIVRYLRETPPPEIRFEVNTPPTSDPLSFAISPDGRQLVFLASNEGKSQLWVRPLDSLAARPVAGTENASYPFWSPDSASVGFFADGKLKRIDSQGGALQVLANAPNGRGGAWNRDGVILFTPTGAGPLFKVPAAGGEAVAITRLETGQASQRFPQFLPDGRRFIYFSQGGQNQGVYVSSLDATSSRRLGDADGAAVVSAAGFLLFPRQATLFAQAFDFTKQEFSGNPFPVAETVAYDGGLNVAGISASGGVVTYRTGTATVRQLTWLDRSGKVLGTIGAPDTAGLTDAELSPDGRRVAVSRTIGGNTDVWLLDAIRGVPTRFIFDAATDWRSVWSPDGSRVVFQSNRVGGGVFDLYAKPSSGAGVEELLLKSNQAKAPNDWSADGRFLLFRSLDPQTGYDLWVLPLSGDKKPFLFVKTPFEERDGQFSLDGKWIAYQSNESGRLEIYVQPFPGPSGKFQVSTNGGVQPRWNKNGKEIFFVSLDTKMMATPVKLSPDGQSPEIGTPVVRFPVRIAGGAVPAANKQQYAVSADGQGFLVNLAVDEGTTSPITIIYNWQPAAN